MQCLYCVLDFRSVGTYIKIPKCISDAQQSWDYFGDGSFNHIDLLPPISTGMVIILSVCVDYNVALTLSKLFNPDDQWSLTILSC